MKEKVLGLAELIKNSASLSEKEPVINWLETVSEHIGQEHEHRECYATLRNSTDIEQSLIALARIAGWPVQLLR